MKLPTIDEVRMLHFCHEREITAEHLDEYNHVNIKYYAEFWGWGAAGLMRSLGMDFEEATKEDRGYWVLRNVLDYHNEIVDGEKISIYGRMVGRADKLMHNMYYMINETRGNVAASSEILVGYADLSARRLTSFAPEKAAELDAKIAEWDALPWQPHLSGAIHVKR